jgi:ectoine hydroxylase-related dioxygenase (phytanoyl-CoA dioxygenase family)
MCGVWLALEDIEEGAGPLLYYPGSHKWPVILPEDIGAPLASDENPYKHYHLLEKAWEAQIAERGAQAVQFLPKKGQAMIWDAKLWHGGARQTDASLTRHSQVTHYFFEGCSYWTPLTGLDRQPRRHRAAGRVCRTAAAASFIGNLETRLAICSFRSRARRAIALAGLQRLFPGEIRQY